MMVEIYVKIRVETTREDWQVDEYGNCEIIRPKWNFMLGVENCVAVALWK